MYKFPLIFNSFTEEDAKSIYDVFKSGNLTQGSITADYESSIASYFGSKYAIAVNSGSSANLLILSALLYSDHPINSLSPGDEILVPAVSWITTYSPIIQLGLVPKIVDIDPHTLNICPKSLLKAITPKTKCIFAVNLLGLPCDYNQLFSICSKYNLLLIEDNCESMGSIYNKKYSGTFGLMSSQSTYMSHHISTIEGGFILTDDEYMRDLTLSLRSHGWARDLSERSLLYKESRANESKEFLPSDFLFLLPGYNLRTTEINSILGLRQLSKLKSIVEERRYISCEFKNILALYSDCIYTQSDPYYSSCFGFPLISRNYNFLNPLRKALQSAGFETRPIVTGNIMRHPVSRFFPKQDVPLSNADLIHTNGIYIGNYFISRNEAIDSFSMALDQTFQ